MAHASPPPEQTVADALGQSVQDFFRSLPLEAEISPSARLPANVLPLRAVSALVRTSGGAMLTVVLSFDQAVLDCVAAAMLDGLTVSAEEYPALVSDCACEMLNTVMGHCTPHLGARGLTVHLTPPLVRTGQKTLPLPADSHALIRTLQTSRGMADLMIIFSPAGGAPALSPFPVSDNGDTP